MEEWLKSSKLLVNLVRFSSATQNRHIKNIGMISPGFFYLIFSDPGWLPRGWRWAGRTGSWKQAAAEPMVGLKETEMGDRRRVKFQPSVAGLSPWWRRF